MQGFCLLEKINKKHKIMKFINAHISMSIIPELTLDITWGVVILCKASSIINNPAKSIRIPSTK